jgi:DNA-binding MarR family transcriptional regulator
MAAWGGFLRAHAALVRTLDAEMRDAHGVAVTEFEVLLRLSNQPGRRMRMADLASSALLSLSGVTRLVERLERTGLVEREPCLEDRRGSYAVLTGPGLELARTARETHRAGVVRLFLRHFSPDELDQLGDYWRRVLDDDGGDRSGRRGARDAEPGTTDRS